MASDLDLFAALFEERPDLRPRDEYNFELRIYPSTRGHGFPQWGWFLSAMPEDEEMADEIDRSDALAHCIAHLARLVAEAGWTVFQRKDGRYHFGPNDGSWETSAPDTYEAALLAGVGELKQL